VAIRAEEDLTRPGVSFLGQGNVTNTFISRSAYVVEIGEVLLGCELAQHIDVAVSHRVGRKDVVVGNDDHFVSVPDLGSVAEMFFEDTDGPRPTNIMGHQDVYVDPDIVSWLDVRAPGMACQDFLGQGHRRHLTVSPRLQMPKSVLCQT